LKMSMMVFLLHQNSCWSQSAPLFSVGSGYELDKRLCQFGLPNGVKHVMRWSHSHSDISHVDATQVGTQPEIQREVNACF
jgi:hypothetical protein